MPTSLDVLFGFPSTTVSYRSATFAAVTLCDSALAPVALLRFLDFVPDAPVAGDPVSDLRAVADTDQPGTANMLFVGLALCKKLESQGRCTA